MKDDEVLGLMLVLSWLLWLPMMLAATGYDVVVPPWLLIAGLAMPGIAALLAVAVEDGLPGLVGWLDETLDPRCDLRWYVIGVLLPPTLLVLGAAMLFVLTGQPADLASMVSTTRLAPGLDPRVALPGVMVGAGVLQEMGFRGWLLPRLQRQDNALVASATLGAAWAVWMLPVAFYSVVELGVGAMAVPLVAALPLSIVATWLFNGSGGRVLVSGLFTGMSTVVLTSPAAAGPDAVVYAACLAGLAMGILRGHGRETLAPGDRVVPRRRRHELIAG